jgi:hypothetical protein
MSKITYCSPDINNFHSEADTCPNISKLYKLIHKSTHDVDEINLIISEITDEEIMINRRAKHPFLHELCYQVHHSFELIKIIWSSAIFKNYWENKKYVDKYGFTALQLLSTKLHHIKTEKVEWIKNNMKVIPGKQTSSGYGYYSTTKVTDYLVQE